MNTVTSHTSNSSRSPHLEALRADTSNRGRLLLAALDQIDRIGIDNITALIVRLHDRPVAKSAIPPPPAGPAPND